MVELVDTTDLKSVDPKGRAGSSPAPGTKREIAAMRSPVFWFLIATPCLVQRREYTRSVAIFKGIAIIRHLVRPVLQWFWKSLNWLFNGT